MSMAFLCACVFLLACYAFAFGWELGYRRRQNEITPRSSIEPQFCVIWRNPQNPHQKRAGR